MPIPGESHEYVCDDQQQYSEERVHFRTEKYKFATKLLKPRETGKTLQDTVSIKHKA